MEVKWTDLIKLDESGVSRINKVAGVYRISHYDNDGKYYVHYVGQASDLNSRLNQHLYGNEVNACCNKYLKNYTCYFKACSISSQSDRDGAEVALYNHFKPDCVEKIPDVKPININFV